MKRISLLALLLISGILVVSCGDEPAGPSTVLGPVGRDLGTDPTFSLDDLEYETISGTLSQGSGAMIEALTTWPRNCFFGLVVPETSMEGLGPIDFTMSIPTQASYEEYSEELEDRLIIRLGPDGTNFTGPIMVFGTWMPWQGAPPPKIGIMDGDEFIEADVTYVPSTNRYRVRFEVDHFSDWEVGPAEPE